MLEPGVHKLTVRYFDPQRPDSQGASGKGSKDVTFDADRDYARCQVEFHFLPDKEYRVTKSSLDREGRLKLVFGKEWGIYLVEVGSNVVLAQCRSP